MHDTLKQFELIYEWMLNRALALNLLSKNLNFFYTMFLSYPQRRSFPYNGLSLKKNTQQCFAHMYVHVFTLLKIIKISKSLTTF